MKKLIFVFVLAGLFGVGTNFVLAANPSASTTPPSATSTSITFNGVFMANGNQTTTLFEYSTNQSDLPAGAAGNGLIACQATQLASATSGSFTCTLSTPTITAGTTYYFRAIASNISGTVYGNTSSIQTTNSTPSSAPSVNTTPATATATSVTFNGAFMANGGQTTTMFEYSTNQNNLPTGQAGNGSIACQILNPMNLTSGPFTCTLSTPTITAGTTYYFRAIASNISGTTYGSTSSVQTINTTGPNLTSLSPNNGTQGQTINVTLNGSNFVNGATVSFGPGITINSMPTFISSTQLSVNITIPAGANVGTYNAVVTSGGQTTGSQTFTVNSLGGGNNNNNNGNGNGSCGLTPITYSISPSSAVVGSGTTYVVINGNNFDYSSVPRFNGSNRSISGYVNQNQITMLLTGADLAYLGNGSISVASGDCVSNAINFTVTSGSNNGGGGGGYYNSYASVTTQSAGNISSSSATLNGSVDPNGYATTAWFEYGTSSTLASYSETSHVNQGAAISYSSLVQNIANLSPNTTYYFRTAANNSYGTVKGSINSFTTGTLNGVVTTVQATYQTSISARLNGIFVNQNGYSAQGYFEYGTTSSLGSTTSAKDLGTYSSVNFSDVINSLNPGTIYYFRAVTTNQGSTYKGNIVLFQTKGAGDTTVNVDTNTGSAVTTAQSSILKITTTTDNISVGGNIEYLVTFNNKNSTNLENTKISIQLPKEIDFTESNFGKVNSDNIVELNAGIMVPNQLGSMTIKGKVNSNAGDKSVLVTTAVMTYNVAGSTSEHDEIAFVTNHIVVSTGLEANSLFGANFLPSTLLGWLALVLAMLALAVVGRKLFSGFGETKTAKIGNADHIDQLPM